MEQGGLDDLFLYAENLSSNMQNSSVRGEPQLLRATSAQSSFKENRTFLSQAVQVARYINLISPDKEDLVGVERS